MRHRFRTRFFLGIAAVSDALMNTYARYDVAFDHGEGPYLHDTTGRRYLDFGSGIAVTALGHAHPHLVDALTRQAGKLWHVSNLYEIPDQRRLAERLVATSFADSAFFANTGAEAVEGAIKMARRYQYETGHPERYRVLCMDGAFHGRTLAAIAATGTEKALKGFGPPVEGFDRAAFGNLNELRAAITPETAAIMVEPVQGEGGIRPADALFLQGLRTVADEFGLVLIYDEVQCGIGRTGRLFAHEWADAPPDVMALAKGLGGGFPVAAILTSAKVANAMAPGSHGTTFGGNPLAMAVANAVLDVLSEPGFLDHVLEVGALLRSGLEDRVAAHPTLFDGVRGSGLMLGLRCVAPNGEVVEALRRQGLLTVPAADNVVRVLPPLVIEPGHVAEALEMLDAAAAELAQG